MPDFELKFRRDLVSETRAISQDWTEGLFKLAEKWTGAEESVTAALAWR